MTCASMSATRRPAVAAILVLLGCGTVLLLRSGRSADSLRVFQESVEAEELVVDGDAEVQELIDDGNAEAQQLIAVDSSAAVSGSLLRPISISAPDEGAWPARSGHYMKPSRYDTEGPYATNKFWTNWAGDKAWKVFAFPYTMQWSKDLNKAAGLEISHSKPKVTMGTAENVGPDRAERYGPPYFPEYTLGAKEPADGAGHRIVKEGLMGIHAQLLSPGRSRTITYPVFSGMAYVSARYEGGWTPQITTPGWSWGYPIKLRSVKRIRAGVFQMITSHSNFEMRVYVLSPQGRFVDNSYSFDAEGTLNKRLDGWVRVAHVMKPADATVFDASAQAVVTDIDLVFEERGAVRYKFQKVGSDPVLHYAYLNHVKLMDRSSRFAAKPAGIATFTPTKGEMAGYVGDTWALKAEDPRVLDVDFLFDRKPDHDKASQIKNEVRTEISRLLINDHGWKMMSAGGYYSSGKIFQRIAMLCLMSEEFTGASSQQTQNCVQILSRGFESFYSATHRRSNTPAGAYDQVWGGAVNSKGYGDKQCGAADFGNACYNDHHYHYGYFVVSAAVLVKLSPNIVDNAAFMDFVNTLLRDTANPSSEDKYFPRFRAFDWFDLHSWSHGVIPSADGKDEESTSEDINLYYGMKLFGQATGNKALEQLGGTMLAFMTTSIQTFFLMEDGNQAHPEAFVKNRVTGIFLQNKVHYTTWFSGDPKHIHGIQMMPLSSALQLARRPSFCREEWDDIISKCELAPTDSWTPVLLTGAFAVVDPNQAFDQISELQKFDAGLSKAWALYWTAIQPQAGITVR